MMWYFLIEFFRCGGHGNGGFNNGGFGGGFGN
jgi:hypothetical protein